MCVCVYFISIVCSVDLLKGLVSICGLIYHIHCFFWMQKEEFQHTAYATNAYVTIGPLWKQVLQGKEALLLQNMLSQLLLNNG